jgi:A/G-specific adenine glycosylase
MMSRMPIASQTSFSSTVIRWQKQHGRHDLPWQNTRDPYRIWLSEIMLQQTQVAAVMGYYARFLQRFPDVQSLAQAPQQAVMQAWSGLGYYSRARNLHKAAQLIVSDYGGAFPRTQAALQELPGIGRSTAAAIAAFAFGEKAAICDGNVKRVLARVFGVEGFPGTPKVERELWALAESLLPSKEVEAYTQGVMDLGATLCTRKPLCLQDATRCPLAKRCAAYQAGRTHELPAPRPKKTLPEKHARVWIVRSKQGVWLEPRPPTGIWGGLVSLPQSEDVESLRIPAWVKTLGAPDKPQALPSFPHTFTHFKLHLHPVLIEIKAAVRTFHGHLGPKMAEEPHGYWVPKSQFLAAALPAPIKKLLLTL